MTTYLDFDVSEFSGIESLVILKGLVVPKCSVVRKGSTYFLNVPTLDKTQAAFKQLMGIKKKRVVVDDESEKSFKKEASDDDDESADFSDVSDESEQVESDND